ncbi:MAG: glycosyltransferase [Chloroflexi bacterium]|nr:glycosyltransferase [Chloroflexota bacterium]
MYRLAFLSFHGCPVARLGERDSGGMNVYVLELARELARQGNLVDVYTRYHDPSDPQIVDLGDGARVIHLKAGPYDGMKETLYEYIPEFVGNLQKFQRSEGSHYDLIHSHYWLSGRVGMVLSSQWNVPHISTFHTLARAKLRARAGESEPELRLRVEENVMRSVDAIVVSTDQEKQDVVRLYRVALHNVRVVPAGVDAELFHPADATEARRALGLTEGKIVLYVGRIEPLKGLDILINALALMEDTSDTRLVIVGGKPGEDAEITRLESLVWDLDLEEMVTFTGAVSQAALPDYYNAADVFVLPSYHESFGLVALEAMACGTPVAASRVAGLTSFIKEGVTGYLIPWHCAEPFAQRIEMLLSNASLRRTMGEASRARALEMTWARTADRMLDVYSSVTAQACESVAGD